MIYPRLPARLIGGIWILLIAIGGCGSDNTLDREEAAIYSTIFNYMGRRQQIRTIDPETNRGPWTNDETVDCADFQTWLSEDIPKIIPGLASAFCEINQTARPVNPEVIRLLALDTADMDSDAALSLSMLKISTIQVDPTNKQALAFVRRQDGDFIMGSYLLLERDADGAWRVQDEIVSYIS